MNITEVSQVPGNLSKVGDVNLGTTYAQNGRSLLSTDTIVFDFLPANSDDNVTVSLGLSDPQGNWAGVGTSNRFEPSRRWIVQVDTIPPNPMGNPAPDIGWEVALVSNQENAPSDWYVSIYA